MKIGAKVVRHAKYVIFQMAKVGVPRKLFKATLQNPDPFFSLKSQFLEVVYFLCNTEGYVTYVLTMHIYTLI